MPTAAKLLVFPSSSQRRELAFSLTPPEPPVPPKPRRRRKPPVSLSDEQLLALLGVAQAARIRDWVAILVTYWHGLRASETVNLREADIDLREGTIEIRRGKGSEGGLQTLQEHENPLLNERAAIERWLAERASCGAKGGAKPAGRRARVHKMRQSEEIVTFLPDVQLSNTALHSGAVPEAEAEARGGLEPSGPSAASQEPAKSQDRASQRLFPFSRGHFWRLVNRYALAAGIPRRKCKTHMLKHTIAKHLVRAGHPLNEIQEWMGWTTIETMNWYTRADEEELGHRIGETIRHKQGLRAVQQASLFPPDPV